MKKRLLTLIGLLVLPTALFCQVANVSANAMTLVTSYGQVTQSWIEDMNNGGGPVSTVSVGQWLPNPFLGLCFAHMHLTGTSP